MTQKPALRIIGEGSLHLSNNGQGLEILAQDAVARENRPPATGWCDTSHLSRYEGTDFIQWYGRRADGRFYPWGPIFKLTAAGKRLIGETP